MDTSAVLVCHPRPFRSESLFGYILRLSELNGYLTPWSILRLAGFAQSEMLRQEFDFEKLSRIINWSPQDDGRLQDRFLIPKLHPNETTLCPDCVAEKGFIEAHWSLPPMVACPEHRRMALFKCPQCARPIRWYRPRLLECECGCDLSGSARDSITDAEVVLSDLIRRKVLRFEIPTENPAALPLDHLWPLDLAKLLRVIFAIAKHRMITEYGVAHGGSPQQAIKLAAAALQDWPANFTALLKEFADKHLKGTPKKAVSKCKEIYRPLFTDYADPSEKDTDFILSVLIEYAVNQWNYTDAFQMKRFRDRLPTGLCSATEFNLQLASQSCASCLQLATTGNKTADEPIPGLNNQAVTERRDDFIRAKVAAKRLGISAILLHALIGSGVCNFRQSRSGFSQKDIDSFEQRLLNLSQTKNSELTIYQCVSLQTALSWGWDTVDTKLELLRALLDKQIAVVASIGDTIGGLQMDRAAYHRFIGALRERSANDSVSATEAAKALGCDRCLIPGMIRSGVLQGSELPIGLRINKASLGRFKRNYVFLRTVAKTQHTNTGRLVWCCNRIGIPVTWPTRGSRTRVQPFIRSQDVSHLIESFSKTNASPAVGPVISFC